MQKLVLKFGLLATALLLLVKVSQYSILTHNLSNEIWIGVFALLFLGFGVMISQIYFRQKQQPLVSEDSKNEPPQLNLKKIEELNISKREYEVLGLIDKGFSNQEIASQLFISESTVKTHVSNLLSKLDAKRRTQAINIAKELRII
ncbi:MAG: response regulator transcription factor [Saprospiraceae bacterium]